MAYIQTHQAVLTDKRTHLLTSSLPEQDGILCHPQNGEEYNNCRSHVG